MGKAVTLTQRRERGWRPLLNKLRIGAKILLVPLVVLAIMGAAGLVAALQLRSQQDSLAEVADVFAGSTHAGELQRTLGRIQSDIFRLMVWQQIGLAQERINGLHEQLQQRLDKLAQLQAEMDALQPLVAADRFQELSAAVTDYHQRAEETARVAYATPGFAASLVQEVTADYDALNADMRALAENALARTEADVQATRADTNRLLVQLGLSGVAAVLLALGLSFFIQRQIAPAVKRTTASMAGALGDGAISLTDSDRRRRDEIGELARAVDTVKANADALREAERRERDANAAKSEFLAAVSHEVRTPLNGILGMARLLLDGELTRTQRDLAETMLSSGETLLHILNDLLDVSKMESGQLDLDQSGLDIVQVVDHSLRVLEPDAEEKGVALAADIDPAIPRRLTGDPTRLSQMITNLVSNALKFIEYGSVTVVVRPAAAQPHDAVETQRLEVHVEDTGPGLSREVQESVFERHVQGGSALAQKHGGTGLGLWICRQLAELMDGRVGVVSDPGTGARFWFEVAVAVRDPTPLGVTVDASHLVVVLVEPEANVAAILKRRLERGGALVMPFAHAEDVAGATAAIAEAAAGRRLVALMAYRGTPAEPLSPAREVLRSLPREAIDADTPPLLLYGPPGVVRDYEGRPPIYGVLAEPMRRLTLLPTCLEAADPEAAVPASRTSLEARLGQLDPVMTSAGSELPPLEVLLVEDNHVNIRVAELMLERFGHSVTIARNGDEACRDAFDQPFDVILMDRNMPVANGLEATRRIRNSDSANARRPIIGLTAALTDDERRSCQRAGMDAVVGKPLVPDPLWETVRAVIADYGTVSARSARPAPAETDAGTTPPPATDASASAPPASATRSDSQARAQPLLDAERFEAHFAGLTERERSQITEDFRYSLESERSRLLSLVPDPKTRRSMQETIAGLRSNAETLGLVRLATHGAAVETALHQLESHLPDLLADCERSLNVLQAGPGAKTTRPDAPDDHGSESAS